MPLVDDLRVPADENDLERRRFLALVGSGALSIAGIGTLITGVRYLEPAVLFEEDRRLEIGRPEDIPVGTVVVLPRQKIYVVHARRGFYALSAVCTHLGCVTRYERAGARIACPCHGSRFDLEGRVTGGPAPRPLRRLSLTLEHGVLVVDAGKPATSRALRVG